MEFFKSKFRSWTEQRSVVSLREMVDGCLLEYGLDLAALFTGEGWATLEEWLNGVPSNVGRVRNINILIKERKYFQAAGDLRVAIDSTLGYQFTMTQMDVDLTEKLLLLSNKLTVPSAHYELHQQHLRWLFKLKDLPPYEVVLKGLTEEWIDFKKELRPYVERFRRNYIAKDRMRYSPDHEPRTDDVSYDHTLVSKEPYYDGSRVQVNQRRYLATHVPEARNIHVFYRVLMSNRVRVLVNLTEPLERSNHGYRYWPCSTSEPLLLDSGLKVSLIDEVHILPLESDTPLEYLTIRYLSITEMHSPNHSVSTGNIFSSSSKQPPPYILALFHFRNWEDYAIPNRTVLLSTLPRIDDYLERSGDVHYQSPIAVHCHSGVGRTGTFMIVHSIFTRLKTISNEALKELPINILDMLVALRLQREAVQSVSQLAFIFSCIRAYTHIRLSLNNNDVIKRDEKFTRSENYYRLAAYMDSVGALQSQKELFERSVGPISSNTVFETFLQMEADRIGGVMFDDMTDDEVLDWTFRLAKVCSPIHVFLFHLQQKGIGLKKLKEIVDQSRPITILPSSTSSISASTSPHASSTEVHHNFKHINNSSKPFYSSSFSGNARREGDSFPSPSSSPSLPYPTSFPPLLSLPSVPHQDPRNAYHLLFDGEVATLERIVSSFLQSHPNAASTHHSQRLSSKGLAIPVVSSQGASPSSLPSSPSHSFSSSPSRSPRKMETSSTSSAQNSKPIHLTPSSSPRMSPEPSIATEEKGLPVA